MLNDVLWSVAQVVSTAIELHGLHQTKRLQASLVKDLPRVV